MDVSQQNSLKTTKNEHFGQSIIGETK